MSEKEKSDVISEKCQYCGGDIVFNPKKQRLECVQCGKGLAIDLVMTTEKSFANLLNSAPTWKGESQVYHCANCGAKTVVVDANIAVKCDYCGATNIRQTKDLPGLKPDTIATFKITKEEAATKAKKWLSHRLFAPSAYRRTVDAANMNGVYIPAFTFDVNTRTSYTGTQVITHTNTDYINGKPITRSYTTRKPVSGVIERAFDDILIPATTIIKPDLFELLPPFNTNQAYQYRKELLSGFTASHYTRDAKACWQAANTQMAQQIRRQIINKHNGSVENLQVNVDCSGMTYKYVLLPVYVGHSEYKNEKYDLYVNGQTGKVAAKAPVSLGKAFLATAGFLAVLGAAIALALFL